jgi:hypothetical protein
MGYRNISARALYESFTRIEEEIRRRASAVTISDNRTFDSRIVIAMQVISWNVLAYLMIVASLMRACGGAY